MLRAEQIALENSARKQLLEIREREMNYFVGNFNSFGTNAALISGFSLTTLTSINTADFNTTEFSRSCFHVITCITIAASLHCVLSCTFCTGLALRGPAGSMLKAVDGLILERHQIFISFATTIFTFSLQAVATAWVVMNDMNAIISTFVLVFGGFIMYQYCSRIYYRFLIPEELYKSDWGEQSIMEGPKQTLTGTASSSSNSKSEMTSFFKTLVSGKDRDAATVEDGRYMPPQSSSQQVQAAGNVADVFMSGYLTKKGVGMLSTWQRRYFVLSGHELSYYKNKETYLENKEAIKDRPINLRGYCVEVVGMNPMNAQGEDDDGDDEVVEFLLKPVSAEDERRAWQLRADTGSEFKLWTDHLARGCKN